MNNVIILGAGGQIARHVIAMLAGNDDVRLTLFARNTARLADVSVNASTVQGDVLDAAKLKQAVKGQDIVYANLTGEDLDAQAKSVIAAMEAEGVRRLIFVLSLGIYDEVPGKFGKWNNATIGEDLKPFRRAADAIEASGLDYTILRPAWLTDKEETDYELTQRDDPFKGTVVSRKSVADLIVKIIRSPSLLLRGNVGVNKPGLTAPSPTSCEVATLLLIGQTASQSARTAPASRATISERETCVTELGEAAEKQMRFQRVLTELQFSFWRAMA